MSRLSTVAATAAAVVLLMICVVSAGRDFYKILEIDRQANLKTIKKSYRRLAKQYHPDKNQGDETAAQKFQDIASAYECLSDDDCRKKYDRGGEDAIKDQGHGGHGGGFGDSFFSSFFGGGFGGGGFGGGQEEERGVARGEDVTVPLAVTLEQLFDGDFVEVMRAKAVTKPAPGTRKCNCRNEMRTKQMGPGFFTQTMEKVCDKCPNLKYVAEDRVLEVEVESGMPDGHQIKFWGEGEPHLDGTHGDLIFVLNTVKHPRFQRRGDDLFTNVTISLQDALVGFTTQIQHLDEHTVAVERAAVTPHGFVQRVVGEGMPNFEQPSRRGTLFITFDVKFPSSTHTFDDAAKADLRRVLDQNIAPRAHNDLDFPKKR